MYVKTFFFFFLSFNIIPKWVLMCKTSFFFFLFWNVHTMMLPFFYMQCVMSNKNTLSFLSTSLITISYSFIFFSNESHHDIK